MMIRTLMTILLGTFCSIQLLASDPNKPKSAENSYPEDGIFTGTRAINLIKNPGFENKTSNWTLGKYNGGAGLLSTDTVSSIYGIRSALINTENNGNDYTDLQLFTFIPLTNLTRYSITFQAKVKTACLISVSIGNGFETYFEEKFLLRPDTENYGPFTFTSENEDPFSYFSFNLGKTKAKILLDEVEIQADHTEREFVNVISNSGINVNINELANELIIQLPTIPHIDFPVIIVDENGKTLKTDKIRAGESEKSFALTEEYITGRKYILKVFSNNRILAYSFGVN